MGCAACPSGLSSLGSPQSMQLQPAGAALLKLAPLCIFVPQLTVSDAAIIRFHPELCRGFHDSQISKEDFQDVVSLLPENTPLPASEKMTYLLARLEVRVVMLATACSVFRPWIASACDPLYVCARKLSIGLSRTLVVQTAFSAPLCGHPN